MGIGRALPWGQLGVHSTKSQSATTCSNSAAPHHSIAEECSKAAAVSRTQTLGRAPIK